jgi:hypothetical protein
MRVSTNMNVVKRRSRLGMYANMAGIGVLGLGMVASFRQNLWWVSLVALIIGFILAQIGGHNIRRYARSPRPDEVIADSLKGNDDRYQLYNWFLPASHVLLTPNGVYSITAKDQTGEIAVEGDTWRQKFTLSRALMFFAAESLGNPSAEAREQAAKVQSWIRTRLPESTVEVQPAVIFINERAKLAISNPAVPVGMADDLKKWLRGSGKGAPIKAAEYKAVEQLFSQEAAAGSA